MKKILTFILALTIFIVVMPTAQAAVNYTFLKNEYIKYHPGQAIIPYPWEPDTSTRVLPFNYEIPAVPANTFSITACRNEFEPASFIINAQKDLAGITIKVPDLYSTQGNTIPADAINIRLVKVWYQASEKNIWYTTPERNLTPELLINDDSLVKVDYVTKTNYLKTTINGVEQYIDMSNPSATFPSNARIQDASSLQPFSLKAHENKQLWLTVHVPGNTPPEDYYGNITISAPSEIPVIMNFSVRVLPFGLEPAPVEYGLYYTGIIGTPDVIKSTYRSSETYLIELQDMIEHGVLYPTLYQQDNAKLDTALALRDTAGLPKDKIYLLGTWVGHDSYIGNGSTPAELAAIADTVINWRNHTETYGYRDTYFYGLDEVKGDILLSQRPAWQTVHKNGGKIFVAGKGSELLKMGDILDTSVVYSTLNATQAGLFHNYGHEILSYGNPQVGIENPEIYRKNYGFTLWNAGYDGAMDFAYQYRYGQSIWNDYDHVSGTGTRYRDHVFAYPTSNGVIDTIQWEGFREGVDDTRYVASLIKTEGSITSAKTIVSAGLSTNENMTAIRKKVIERILSPQIYRAPVLATADSYRTNEDTPLVVAAPGVLSNDKDVDENPLNAVKVTDPVHGIVVLNANGNFIYTPTANYNGPDSFTYKANNGFQDSAPATVTITVTPEASPTSITVTAPNGGETWQRGTTKTIAWSYTGSPGSTVKIVLLKAGTEVGTIIDSTSTGTSGTGSYSWPIYPSGTTGSDYKVSVQSTSQPPIKDTSNTYFNITERQHAPF